MRIVLLSLALTVAWLNAAFGAPPEIHLEVWSFQHFDDPFCSDDAVEIYFRVDECAYLTIYQINPWGGVDIIYPRPHHRWIMVLPHRTYCLSDLATDLYLHYGGVEGRACIGIIAAPDPIDLVPWLESDFCSYGFVSGQPPAYGWAIDVTAVLGRIQADLRFRIGKRCVPTFFTQVIHLRPKPLPPVVIYGVPRPPARSWGTWNNGRTFPPQEALRQRSRDAEKQHPDVRSRYSPPSHGEGREIAKSRQRSPTPPAVNNKARRVRKPTN